MNSMNHNPTPAGPTNPYTPQGQQPAGQQGASKPPRPPKVGRKGGLAPNLKGAPEDVRVGVWAWLSVCVLQVLIAVVQYLANIADPRALHRQAKDYLTNEASIASAVGSDPNTLAPQLNLSMMFVGIVIAGVCGLLVWRAGRGAVYSRMFLNVGSFYLVILAVIMAFSDAPGSMPAGFAFFLGTITILSGVLAALGVFFLSRPGNREWLGIPSDAEVEKYTKEVERYREEEKRRREAKKEARKTPESAPQGGKGNDDRSGKNNPFTRGK